MVSFRICSALPVRRSGPAALLEGLRDHELSEDSGCSTTPTAGASRPARRNTELPCAMQDRLSPVARQSPGRNPRSGDRGPPTTHEPFRGHHPFPDPYRSSCKKPAVTRDPVTPFTSARIRDEAAVGALAGPCSLREQQVPRAHAASPRYRDQICLVIRATAAGN